MTNRIFSLHIGVAYTDNTHYDNNLVALPCCATDAKLMYRLAKLLKYDKTKLLIDEKATTNNVKKTILKYSKELVAGDLCILTFSGHGALIPDLRNYKEKEKRGSSEKRDNTWCLYDRQLIDDELPHLWKKFKKGVNILVLLDACHSGTGVRDLLDEGESIDYFQKTKGANFKSTDGLSSTNLPDVVERNKATYLEIKAIPEVEEATIDCSVLLLSACQDEEQALAGSFVSFFTKIVINALANKQEAFSNYMEFHELVQGISKKEKRINPNFYTYGQPITFFEKNRPFLKSGEDYPAKLKRLYVDYVLESDTLFKNGLQNDGLLIDLDQENVEAFEAIAKDRLEKISSFSFQDNKNGKQPIYKLNLGNRKGFIDHPWDKAYSVYDLFKNNGISTYVEPALIYEPIKNIAKSPSKKENSYLSRWPSPEHEGVTNEFTWHLGDEFSQLASARAAIISTIPEEERHIKIAHIDTGYTPHHPGLPTKIGAGFSFVKGEEDNPGIDLIKNGGKNEQDYHGTATMSLLAGAEIPETLAYGKGDRKLGAAPFATIYPLRISDTVALVLFLKNTIPFIKAVEKAIELECEVISVSVGGAPVRGWAKAINAAYEAGITIVAAAGNSWIKGIKRVLPKKVLYPARFDRVIAATGVTCNQFPYDFNANPHSIETKTANGEYMQGNYLPKSAMKSAIAAYTPNIAWVQFDEKIPSQPVVLKTGGGTSSATPQVSAAVAMWLIKNRKKLKEKNYNGTWKQVEAVKHALFEGADKSYFNYKKYYGHGTLKAMRTLAVEVPEENALKKAKKVKVHSGLLTFLKMIILRKSLNPNLLSEDQDEVKSEMVAQEILQILERDPVLSRSYYDLDLEEEEQILTKEQFQVIFEAVQKSAFCSEYLKAMPRIL